MLTQASITRYGRVVIVRKPFLFRTGNGLVFTSRSYTAPVKIYGLTVIHIPLKPGPNGIVEWLIQPLKEQYGHRHRFVSLHITQTRTVVAGSAFTITSGHTKHLA